MSTRRVIVAHASKKTREQLRTRLTGLEVIAVENIDQLIENADKTFDGMIVSCCFSARPHDGLSMASLYRDKQIGTFRGFVLGLACCEAHGRDFSNHDICSSNSLHFVTRVMKAEMSQLG